MSANTFTPGKWVFAGAAHEDAEYIIGTAEADPRGDGYNPQVAMIRNSKASLANARLIASAPDLLAALERLASSQAFDLPRAMNRPDDNELILRMEFARAAIAKARGV